MDEDGLVRIGHLASRVGRVEFVKSLRWAGVDLARTSVAGRNMAIHESSENGHVELVEYLIAAGADVNAKGRRDRTPLHQAALEGHVDVVALLLENGAHVDAQDSWNDTPLHKAASQGRVQVVKRLLEAGAEVDAWGSSGDRPLHKAVEAGDAYIVEVLVRAGADVTATNRSHRSPRDLAKESVMLALLQPGGAAADAAGGWLGVKIQDEMTPELAASFGLQQPVGALIARVVRNGPAHEAGVQTGDIIMEFGGEDVPDSASLPPMVRKMRPGDQVEIKVLRRESLVTLHVVIGVR